MYTVLFFNLESINNSKNKEYMLTIEAIKTGPKPKTDNGDLDKRHRVAPPNAPKNNPPLKVQKPKK
jgi:hypothetical protein